MSGLFGKVNSKAKNAKEKCVMDLASSSICLVGADGLVRDSLLNANAEACQRLAHDRELIVLVPGEDVFTTSVTLPKMSANKLKKAIPYALEDKVIDDLSALHFADFADATYKSFSSLRYVMIVGHEKMQTWLATLHAMELSPKVVLPTYFAIHEKEALDHDHDTTANILVTPQNTVLCHYDDKYFATDRENISLYLAECQSLEKMLIKNFTSTPLSLSGAWHIEETLLPENEYIHYLAKGYSRARVNANLLQQQYAFKAPSQERFPKLQQKSVYLLVASLFLFFLYPIVPYFYLKARVDDTNTRIASIYKRQFPNAQNIVAPKQRLEEKLIQLKTRNGGDRFFYLLAHLSNVLPQSHQIKLQRLDYLSNQLTLKVLASSSDAINDFSDFLIKEGLSVKQQNTTLVGEDVHAAIQIE